MSFQNVTSPAPVQHLSVYRAEDFRVTHGVNLGDAVTDARELVLEDTYELGKTAKPGRLAIMAIEETANYVVAAESALGQPGSALYFDCLATFMGPQGSTDEALILVEVDPATGLIRGTYLLPLTPMQPLLGYTLVRADPENPRGRFAESACVSFARGTHITMLDGRQKPIEEIKAGDKVLTRDSGPQEVRWIGQQTVRAAGAFAPIEIAAGVLNNTGPLTLSPNHRLFIYQRVDAVGAGRKEVLVKARLLVNGTTVVQTPGGFVDYYQILFDKHEIIYAEGIASESLFVDVSTRPALPDEVQKRLIPDGAENHHATRNALELGEAELAHKDAVDLLRRASTI